MRKMVLFLFVFLFVFSLVGVCAATTYSHGVATTSSTGYVFRQTSWVPASSPGLAVEVDCDIRRGALFNRAYMNNVIPVSLGGSSFEYGRGRVWGDKGGSVYTSWVDINTVSEEVYSTYSSSYTFEVQVHD